jgi:hypothetical protein
LNTEDFLKLSPEYQKIYLEQIDSNLEFAKVLRMKAASEAVAQEEEKMKAKARSRDKTASSYNLMGLIAGGPVITSRDDDVVQTGEDHILRMHSGSTNSNNTDSEKVRKSYELMRAFTRG